MPMLDDENREVNPPQPPGPPMERKRFISLVSQLEELYLQTRDFNRLMSERTEAGHGFVTLGVLLLPDEEKKVKEAVMAFVRNYSPPTISFHPVVGVDNIPVIRIDVAGPGHREVAARADIPLTANPEPWLKLLERQRYERYFITEVIKHVQLVARLLVKHNVLRLRGEELTWDYSELFEGDTNPVYETYEGDEENDAIEGDKDDGST